MLGNVVWMISVQLKVFTHYDHGHIWVKMVIIQNYRATISPFHCGYTSSYISCEMDPNNSVTMLHQDFSAHLTGTSWCADIVASIQLKVLTQHALVFGMIFWFWSKLTFKTLQNPSHFCGCTSPYHVHVDPNNRVLTMLNQHFTAHLGHHVVQIYSGWKFVGKGWFGHGMATNLGQNGHHSKHYRANFIVAASLHHIMCMDPII